MRLAALHASQTTTKNKKKHIPRLDKKFQGLLIVLVEYTHRSLPARPIDQLVLFATPECSTELDNKERRSKTLPNRTFVHLRLDCVHVALSELAFI